MINRNFTLKTIFLCLLALSPLHGFCSEIRDESTSCYFSQVLFEVKTGYFFFSDSKMRKIYDRNGIDIQLSTSYPLKSLNHNWTLNAYSAVEYFYRSGKSINGHQNTSLWSVPISLGLKPVYNINDNIQNYFAIGPRYFYIHQHNHSQYVSKNKSKNAFGFFVNTGINYHLCDQFIIDIFGEYSYGKILSNGERSRVYTRNIQFGGFTFGGGLGYEF